VTFGAFLSKRIGARDAAFYVVAQIIGATIAAMVILFIARGMPGGYDPVVSGLGAEGYGLHSPGHYSLVAGFTSEVILTAMLVITVLGTTDARAPAGFAGLAIGLVITLVLLIGIPITNVSVNPARSLGPALIVRGWAIQQIWLFIVAPLIGAALAAGAYAAIWPREAKS
jgi:aquaporin Z